MYQMLKFCTTQITSIIYNWDYIPKKNKVKKHPFMMTITVMDLAEPGSKRPGK